MNIFNAVPQTLSSDVEVSSSLSSGQRLYYKFAFATNGITLRLNVTTGTIICYASDLIQNPNEQQGYVWKITSSTYIDVFLDPTSLNRPAGSFVYVALEGSGTTNNFRLNSSTGDRRRKTCFYRDGTCIIHNVNLSLHSSR